MYKNYKNIAMLLIFDLLVTININSATKITTNEDKTADLCKAIHAADIDSLKQLISEKIDLNYKCKAIEGEFYPLRVAIDNIENMIPVRISTGGYYHSPNSEGLNIVQILLDNGANPNLIEYNKLPLLIHLTNSEEFGTIKNFKLFKMLVDAGADINVVDNEGNSVVSHLIEQLLKEYYAGKLIKKKIDIAEHMIKLLINKGINLDHINKHGKTASDLVSDIKPEISFPYMVNYHLPPAPMFARDITRYDFNNIKQLVEKKFNIDERKQKIVEALKVLPTEVAKIIGEYDYTVDLPSQEEIDNLFITEGSNLTMFPEFEMWR